MTDFFSKRFQLRYYKLVGTLVVPAKDMLDWAKWFQHNDRHVRQEIIGETRVSTVFLGLDHRMYWPETAQDAQPLVFETMIFPTDIWDGYQTRCSTYEEAIYQHEAACDHVRTVQRQLPVVRKETSNG